MEYSSRRALRPIWAVLIVLLFGTAAISIARAQERKVPQTDGVDNTKMGAYRALARQIYSEFQKGDNAAAAQLARILERVWDKAEDYGGDMALKKTHPDQFEEIDRAMDEFISPLMEYKSKAPETTRVRAAFNAYLEKLALAD